MDGKKEQSGGSVPSEAGTRRCRPHDRRHGCSPTRYHDPVPDSSPSTAGRIIKIALGLGIGAFFFYLVARGLDWADVRDVLRTSEPLWLIPILVAIFGHFVFKSLRWRVLLSESVDLPRIFTFRLTMVGFFLNNVIPFRIGELARPYLLSANRPEVPFSFAVATVLANKLFDLLTVVIFLLVAALVLPLPSQAKLALAIVPAIALVFITSAFVAAAWRNRELARSRNASGLLRILSRFGVVGTTAYDVFLEFAHGLSTLTSVRRVAHALLHSITSSACLVVTVWCIMRMVGLTGSLANALFVVGMIGAGSILPSPPTNAGTHHFFASLALTLPSAASEDVAFSFSLISHASEVLLVAVVGAVCIIGLDWRKAKRVVEEREAAEKMEG